MKSKSSLFLYLFDLFSDFISDIISRPTPNGAKIISINFTKLLNINLVILNNKDNYMNSIKFNKKTIKKARKNNSVCRNISEKLEKCKKGFIDE